MKNKRFVVFLDVDGVLNSKTTVQKTPEGYRGIDDARVEILSKVIEKMGGDTGRLCVSGFKTGEIWFNTVGAYRRSDVQARCWYSGLSGESS